MDLSIVVCIQAVDRQCSHHLMNLVYHLEISIQRKNILVLYRKIDKHLRLRDRLMNHVYHHYYLRGDVHLDHRHDDDGVLDLEEIRLTFEKIFV
jgi:hypothetical protein